MKAQAAAEVQATPEVTLALVGPAAEATAQAALNRFEAAIQSVLDAPLDAARVLEWTRLRAVGVIS
ncbi:MAG TPA: hypothetical protein VEU29_00955 [Actinomycetota bacterium]|nr:hypothetical protein [Actinomycetota bacterium]